MHFGYHNGLALLERRGFRPDASIHKELEEKDHQATDALRSLLCARCGLRITTRDQRIAMEGMHEHTFANPHGIIYRIGCFRSAPGCTALSEEYKEFTWFEGFVWSHAVCTLCHTHLGWRYRMVETCFYGLVLDRLVEKEEH